MSVRGIVRWGNYPSGKCLGETVRRGSVRWRNVRRGTVLEPSKIVFVHLFISLIEPEHPLKP